MKFFGQTGSGDRQKWFTGLYKRQVDTVYRVCYTYFKNVPDTEDAVQSVFIKLLAKPRDFESREHEKAWLIRVAANHCKDVLKNAWNRRTDLENIPEPEAPKESVDETLEVVMKLPENQRICVYLFYYEGYNAAEIAEIIEKPHSTVRNYLSDARQTLKKELAGDFDE